MAGQASGSAGSERQTWRAWGCPANGEREAAQTMLYNARTAPLKRRLNDQTAECAQTFERRRAKERRLLGSLRENHRRDDLYNGRHCVEGRAKQRLRVVSLRIARQRIRCGNRVVRRALAWTGVRGRVAFAATTGCPVSTAATCLWLRRRGGAAATGMPGLRPRSTVRTRRSRCIRRPAGLDGGRLRQVTPATAGHHG